MQADTHPDDAQLYLVATKEVDSRNQDEALWAKSLALSEGDTEKARYTYIQLRVAQLSEQRVETPNNPDRGQPSASAEPNSSRQKIPMGRALSAETDQAIIQAIRDGDRSGQKADGVWYLQDETEEAHQGNGESSVSNRQNDGAGRMAQMDREGFLLKLVKGEYGLAKTYWLFGVAVGLIVGLFLGIITDQATLLVFTFVYLCYQIAVLIGIWRAADNYTGPKHWVVLAKLAAILGWFQLGAILLGLAAT